MDQIYPLKLLTFPNVLVTSHQAFFTIEALRKIAETTIGNITAFEDSVVPAGNLVTRRRHVRDEARQG